MIRKSLTNTHFVHTTLLNLHCTRSVMALAHHPFDEMPSRAAPTSDSLMAEFSRIGSSHQAPNTSPEPRKLDITTTHFSYNAALDACADVKDLAKGRMIHALTVTAGLAPRSFMTNSLIGMYSNCGRIDEARMVFDRAAAKDDGLWNSLFSGYVRMGWPEVALNVLVWMERCGAKLNGAALRSVVKACAESGGSRDVERMVHGCVIKIGLDLDLFAGSAAGEMYAENEGLDELIGVFELTPSLDLVVFSAMIAGFSWLETGSCGDVGLEALRLYSEMLRRGMRPSKFTYKSVLRVCRLARAFGCGKQIHARVIASGLQDDEFVGSTLIDLYSASGLIEDSFRCFSSSKKESIDVWTSMITGYVLNEHFERALLLFTEMLSLGKEPDQFLVSSLLMASANLGVMRSGEQIHSHAMKAGLDRFTVCSNSQTDMYAKLGDLEASIRTFENIQDLDAVSWSAVISSHALNGCETEALKLFGKMTECMQVAPNHNTFIAVLIACGHGGPVDEGFRYFESMQIDYGMAPTPKHLACIVDLLGRFGRLAEAEDLVLSSAFDHEPLVWRVLLNSCQFHGDNERGIRVGERLLELEPLEATSYMELYSMYMNIGRISLAMRTRGLMRERGVNKEIGACWIEIGGSLHSFRPGDYSHPRSHAIYAKLDEMLFKIKHMSQADVKILQLEYCSEKWKESIKNSHGEMLAVALGMVDLPKQVPIRTMKNTRVCVDCHTSLKFFSESERREIILRDPTRIHHFRLGLCSCGDYW